MDGQISDNPSLAQSSQHFIQASIDCWSADNATASRFAYETAGMQFPRIIKVPLYSKAHTSRYLDVVDYTGLFYIKT